MVTRRKFLVACSTSMAVLALAPISSFSMPAISGASYQSPGEISHALLAGQINTLFRIHISTLRGLELKLIKAPLASSKPVRPGSRMPDDVENEKFSLVFSGSSDELIHPAIHLVEHEKLGRFEMYLGQIGIQDNGHVYYEAVFNRPKRDLAVNLNT